MLFPWGQGWNIYLKGISSHSISKGQQIIFSFECFSGLLNKELSWKLNGWFRNVSLNAHTVFIIQLKPLICPRYHKLSNTDRGSGHCSEAWFCKYKLNIMPFSFSMYELHTLYDCMLICITVRVYLCVCVRTIDQVWHFPYLSRWKNVQVGIFLTVP